MGHEVIRHGRFEKVDRGLLKRVPTKRFSSSARCRRYILWVCYPENFVAFLVQRKDQGYEPHCQAHPLANKRARGGEQGSSSSSVKIVVKGRNWISLQPLQGNPIALAWRLDRIKGRWLTCDLVTIPSHYVATYKRFYFEGCVQFPMLR